ncbi:Gfo/Idh/MocA family oxidoreductase [Thermopolyspora sp. NPDC052614]|uniref:Gfo/Idh/MocA family protein n=1 Tax=Thermopolyspora sp. NPDC052614 TaxID=3155682 RepID=UPI0034126E1F
MADGTGGTAEREPLRIGVLGAARIAGAAIARPARDGGHRLVAIAARDRARAEEFAARHGVERVAGSYAEVVTDPRVEVVYNPLPNGLHGPWNLAALAAGKHVLTEKPSAANREEAAEVRDAVAKAGTVFMEGFHYLFHPVTRRLHELVDGGELGEIRHVAASFQVKGPPDDDPRWSLALAGGALMDLGCYNLHALRMLAPWTGGEPRVVAARGGERAGLPGVDEWLDADLEFPGGATASARCHMSYDGRVIALRVVGSRGEATAVSFALPHQDNRVIIRTPDGERVETPGDRTSYHYQLEAFAAHVRHGTPLPIDADDAVATMALIDDAYRAAGFEPRPRHDRSA